MTRAVRRDPPARREQRVEGALATIGERDVDDVVEAGALEAARDRRGRVGGRQGASELVRTRDGADHVQ